MDCFVPRNDAWHASSLRGLSLKTAYADKAGQRQVKNLTYNTINEFFFNFGIGERT
jgi:hypothetical protein